MGVRRKVTGYDKVTIRRGLKGSLIGLAIMSISIAVEAVIVPKVIIPGLCALMIRHINNSEIGETFLEKMLEKIIPAIRSSELKLEEIIDEKRIGEPLEENYQYIERPEPIVTYPTRNSKYYYDTPVKNDEPKQITPNIKTGPTNEDIDEAIKFFENLMKQQTTAKLSSEGKGLR